MEFHHQVITMRKFKNRRDSCWIAIKKIFKRLSRDNPRPPIGIRGSTLSFYRSPIYCPLYRPVKYIRAEPRTPLFPFLEIPTNRFPRIGLAISFRRGCAPELRRYIPVRTDSEKPIVILCYSWLSHRTHRDRLLSLAYRRNRSARRENKLFIATRIETWRNRQKWNFRRDAVEMKLKHRSDQELSRKNRSKQQLSLLFISFVEIASV